MRPMLRFHETEGVTVVVEHGAAVAAGLAGVFPCRMITLEVHSALDAVGFFGGRNRLPRRRGHRRQPGGGLPSRPSFRTAGPGGGGHARAS
jgi:hypothetical protein